MSASRMLAALTLACALVPAHGDLPKVGKPVPSFSMKTTTGGVVTSQMLKGKVVLLDFWATWCGPCKMASPVMQKLHQKYWKKGLVVIGANTFERNDKKGVSAKKYRAEHRFTYLFSYNNDALSQAWGISSIPTFCLIDKKGKVLLVEQGFDPSMESAFAKRIEAALAAK